VPVHTHGRSNPGLSCDSQSKTCCTWFWLVTVAPYPHFARGNHASGQVLRSNTGLGRCPSHHTESPHNHQARRIRWQRCLSYKKPTCNAGCNVIAGGMPIANKQRRSANVRAKETQRKITPCRATRNFTVGMNNFARITSRTARLRPTVVSPIVQLDIVPSQCCSYDNLPTHALQSLVHE